MRTYNSGEKYARLTLIRLASQPGAWDIKWLTDCSCGNPYIVFQSVLMEGNTLSCGCLREDVRMRYGEPGWQQYGLYRFMISRCYRPKTSGYAFYGGRGIEVCERWLDKENGFLNFLEDMWPRPKGKTLDRKDSNGPYSSENCRWATPIEQANNKSNNHLITHKGETHTKTEWARKLDIPVTTLDSRTRRGNDPEEILGKSLRATYKERTRHNKRSHYLMVNGEEKLVVEWAEKMGIDQRLIHHRLSRGWTEEDAVLLPDGTPKPKDKPHPREKFLEHNGLRMNLSDWARHLGLTKNKLQYRLRKGLPIAEVLSPVRRKRNKPGPLPSNLT